MHTISNDPIRQQDIARVTEAPRPPLHERAHEVATRFEELFVQQMVTAMRTSAAGIAGEGMFGAGAGSDTYGAWFDQCMAAHIASNGGVGLARIVEKNILDHAPDRAPARGEGGALPLTALASPRSLPLLAEEVLHA